MKITREMVAEKLRDYLHHKLTLEQLVDWAESAMMEGDFDEAYEDAVRDVVARLGLADVRAFDLSWEDCQALLKRLGYTAHIDIVAG